MLVTSGKSAYLIGRYTIHIHKFSDNILTGKSRLRQLRSLVLKNRKSRLKSSKKIFLGGTQ